MEKGPSLLDTDTDASPDQGDNGYKPSLLDDDTDQAPQPTKNAPRTSTASQPELPTNGVGMAEDVLKSLGSGFSRGTYSLAGLPGDVETLGRMGAKYLGANVSPQSYLPTSSDVISKIENLYPPSAGTLEYAPQTGAGRFAKTIGEFVPGFAAGPESVANKLASATGAGIATQGTEELMPKDLAASPQGAAIKFLASIPGSMAGSGLTKSISNITQGITSPEASALNRMSAARSSDIARGVAPEISESEIPYAASAGPEARRLIQRSAEKAPEDDVAKFTGTAQSANESAVNKIINYIDNTFNNRAPVDPFSERDAIRQAANLANSTNYRQLFSSPNAQNIMSPEISDAINKLQYTDVLKSVANTLGIQHGDPTAKGMIQLPGGKWTVNPQGAPLETYDLIKRELDGRIGQLSKPLQQSPTAPSEIRNYTQILTPFRAALDNAVPEYANVRGAAAEQAGFINALDMGMKYFQENNPSQISLIDNIYNKFTDEQKQNAAYGLVGAYRQMMSTNSNRAFNYFTGPASQGNIQKFRNFLGDDADPLIGNVVQQNLMRNIQTLRQVSLPNKIGQFVTSPAATGAAGGAAGMALTLGESLMQPALWGANIGFPQIAAVLGPAGLSKLYNVSEARIAQKVLELSMDPSRAAELGQLTRSNPAARSWLNKTSTLLGQLGSGVAANTPAKPDQGRIQRKSGGRVSHETRADQLIAAAERSKKSQSNATEVLLDQPDEAITRALSIAKQHI